MSRARRAAPTAPLDQWGDPLRLDEPEWTEWTEDDRFWDGQRLYTLMDPHVSNHHGDLLAAADVIVEALDNCLPGHPMSGGVRVLPPEARAKLAKAGFVRMAKDSRGEVQSRRAEDGTRLVLLTGPVVRPRLD